MITAVGGVYLAIHTVRDKERKAARAEMLSLEGMLAAERAKRINAELTNYNLMMLLAENGIRVPRDE